MILWVETRLKVKRLPDFFKVSIPQPAVEKEVKTGRAHNECPAFGIEFKHRDCLEPASLDMHELDPYIT